jgi:pyruvate kinase
MVLIGMSRSLHLPSTTRDLPLPIDRFDLRRAAKMYPLECGQIDFWVTVNAKYDEKVLSNLLIDERITGVRFNAVKYESIDLLEQQLKCIKKIEEARSLPLQTCFDTNGPKIRTFGLTAKYGQPYLDIYAGEIVQLLPAQEVSRNAATKSLPINGKLPPVRRGTVILMSDGWLQLEVLADAPAGSIVEARALNDSRMFEGRGVDAPSMYDDVDPLTTADVHFLNELKARQISPHYFGLSFASSVNHIRSVHAYLQDLGIKTSILAKIETVNGFKERRALAVAAGGIMIARGDLAVQMARAGMDMLEVEMALLSECAQTGRRCLIATRVADSVAEGRAEFDDYEIARLNMEVCSGQALTLVLCNETNDPSTAMRNVKTIICAVERLQSTRKSQRLQQ